MKIRGTIRGRSIFLDTLPGFGMDQRVEVDITSVSSELKVSKELSPRPRISPERLEELIRTDPRLENVREARNLRKRLEQKSSGHKIDVAQLVREDRDR